MADDIRRLRYADAEPETDRLTPAPGNAWVGVVIDNGVTFPVAALAFYWVKPVRVSGPEIIGDPFALGDFGAATVRPIKCCNLGSAIPIPGDAGNTTHKHRGGTVVEVVWVPDRWEFSCSGGEPTYPGDPDPDGDGTPRFVGS